METIKYSLDQILELSISRTMEEIKDGANSDDFKDLTIMNFIILASRQNYDNETIKNYINDFRYEDDE